MLVDSPNYERQGATVLRSVLTAFFVEVLQRTERRQQSIGVTDGPSAALC